MNINIKATNIELTEAIDSYVRSRLDGLDKFKKPEEEMQVFVEVGKTSNRHKRGDYYRAEFNIEISGKKFYTFSEKSDLYKSIDDAKKEILRQIKNSQGRKRELIKKGATAIKNILRGFSHKG
jgi:ribosomal subunit interface protein